GPTGEIEVSRLAAACRPYGLFLRQVEMARSASSSRAIPTVLAIPRKGAKAGWRPQTGAAPMYMNETRTFWRMRAKKVALCAKRSIDIRSLSVLNRRACEKVMGWHYCNAIEWGLSERVYRERHAKFKKAYWFSDEKDFSDQDIKTFYATPHKMRHDLP